jgi:hypothetical protein
MVSEPDHVNGVLAGWLATVKKYYVLRAGHLAIFFLRRR